MPEAKQQAYRVLARKYRPTTLAELVGQDVLVRTLTNAFATGRIAHAFLLTGVRGVGKTTTARIIARALNCVGPDGKGGPTIAPCGACEHCRAIAEDRSVDVLEMDAASRTGVDDIRSLTEGARYAPVSARTKVYILDEVHMLSKAAFNALLKTLEEPPPHVTFVFATTESRKLPLTILSRCQRFDLRRVEPALLAAHLSSIAAKEGVPLAEDAALLLGRAADGSVRDGLSLLDQAMALAQQEGITAALVQEMLGLADRSRTFDLLDALLGGDVAGALGHLRAQYDLGADPVLVLQDLLDLVHWLTRLKAVPTSPDCNARTAVEQERGRAAADKVSMPALARAWSMLLKGLEEAGQAPDPMAAVEMVLVRLAYVADLPSPAEVVEKLSAKSSAETRTAVRVAPVSNPPAPLRESSRPLPQTGSDPGPRARANFDQDARLRRDEAGARPGADKISPRDRPPVQRAKAPDVPLAARPTLASPPTEAIPDIKTFGDVVRVCGERGEPRLRAELIQGVHIVSFAPGRIELRMAPRAQKDMPSRLALTLQGWTGRMWSMVLSTQPGQPTLAEQEAAVREQRLAEARTDPAVQAVLAAFPGAKIREVRDVQKAPPPMPDAAPDEPGDESS
ncbi:MAG: DNA polymerase III subunit gamma/tau [Alphaproteobacteria bacterium]|nr:DNA polymerase III subunit gamma/tau [Alphaproteobacteria bacterium]